MVNPNMLTIRDGVGIDFSTPTTPNIFLVDIAERMARMCPIPSGVGFYSLAQRSCLLAAAVAGSEGALAGCYALLNAAPAALTGFLEDEAQLQLYNVSRFVPITLDEMRARLARTVHEALDLDSSPPREVVHAILAARQRLDVAEAMCLRRGAYARAHTLQTAGVRPLVNRISPIGWDKAFDQFVSAWRTLATAAELRHTPAWNGLP